MKYLSILKSSLPVGSAAGGLDAVRAAQLACVALTGLFLFRVLTQGFGRFAALLWALLRRAFSASLALS